jgi:hypothetical protein
MVLTFVNFLKYLISLVWFKKEEEEAKNNLKPKQNCALPMIQLIYCLCLCSFVEPMS